MAAGSVDAQVAWVVEPDPAAARETPRHAFFSAAVTLTLGVLGSSILPIPFAMSRTGILVGCLTMLLVAWANSLTACYLIRAAAYSGKTSYEGLAEWAGGRGWRVFTQASLVVLLWGTLCGGLALISDVGYILTAKAYGEEGPPPFVNGRTCMVAVTALVLFPLCHTKHMRQLERAATAGVVMVVLLIGLLAANAFQLGFPALASGELALWSLHVDSHLPEAFSVFGYAFYMQPMMMPLVAEMPHGPAGVAMMERVVHVVLFGVAFLVYFGMGVFGASIFGAATAGNIMTNEIVQGRAACIALYGAMLVYLSFGMTTTQYALRASLELLLFGAEAPFSWRGMVAINTATIGSALAVALTVPQQAEKIYAVVGATAVCVVCYIIPAFIQLHRYWCLRAARQPPWPQDGTQRDDFAAPLLVPSTDAAAAPALVHNTQCSAAATATYSLQGRKPQGALHQWLEVMHEGVLPVLVVLLGVGFSVAALWVALLPWLQGRWLQGRAGLSHSLQA